MLGRKGPRDKAHHAVPVPISSARARLRRWLVVPAALAGVLPAVLLGATPARAAGGCNRFTGGTLIGTAPTSPDGYPGDGQGAQVSTGSKLEPWAPGIARSNGATVLAATGIDYSLWFYWNIDGSLRYYWSHDGTPTWYQGQIAPPGYATSSPSITRSSSGTEIAVRPDRGNRRTALVAAGWLPPPGRAEN